MSGSVSIAISIRPQIRGIAFGLILLVGLSFPGCGSDDSGSDKSEYVGIAADVVGSPQELTKQVDGVLAACKAGTEACQHDFVDAIETEHTLPARCVILRDPPPLPPTQPVERSVSRITPLGRVVATIDAIPPAIAVTNGGNVLYTARGRLMMSNNSGNPALILDAPAEVMQLNASGRRLLVQWRTDVYILAGEGFSQRSLLTNTPPGTAQWAIDRDDSLLFVHERLNMDASERNRIYIQVMYYDLATGASSEPSWEPDIRYARIGTLPALRQMWGHFSKPYQINPRPAPILFLKEGTPIDYVTNTDRAMDYYPSGDSEGNLYWVRMYRQNDDSGRAWFRSVRDKQLTETQMSGVPTYRIAVSPDGKWIAHVVKGERDGSLEVRLISRSDLLQQSSRFAAFAESDRVVIASALGLQEDMRRALAEQGRGASIIQGEFGAELSEPPGVELIASMTEALRVSLANRFSIEEPAGLRELQRIDVLLQDIGGYLVEDPPLVIALAGVLAEALGTEATWNLDGARAILTSDVRDSKVSDDLSYTAIAPFGVAREAISAQMSLAAFANQVLHVEEKPVYLVENFRDNTLRTITALEWERAGLPADNIVLGDLYSALEKRDDTNDVVSLMAIRIARANGEPKVELRAALNLAAGNPTSPKALEALAQCLADNYYTADAERIYDMLTLLEPTDAYIHMTHGDVLLALDRVDEAKEAYETALLLDLTETFAGEIQGRIRLLEELHD